MGSFIYLLNIYSIFYTIFINFYCLSFVGVRVCLISLLTCCAQLISIFTKYLLMYWFSCVPGTVKGHYYSNKSYCSYVSIYVLFVGFLQYVLGTLCIHNDTVYKMEALISYFTCKIDDMMKTDYIWEIMYSFLSKQFIIFLLVLIGTFSL